MTLTDLGIRAVDSKHAGRARVDSFLAVPLFKAVFDKLNGSALPPAATIERLMEQLGVAPKQKNSARQVFMRSAKQAGFLSIDPDRLTLPPSQHISQSPEQLPEAGTPMSPRKREALVAAFTATVGYIYPDRDEQ